MEITQNFTCRVHTDSNAIKLKAFPNRMQHGVLIATPDAPSAVSAARPQHATAHMSTIPNSQRGYGLGVSDPDAAESVLSFCVQQPSRVYVCVDRQMAESGQAPTWLAARGWQVVTDSVALIADEMFDYYVIFTLPAVVPKHDL